ncbi:MAG: hypothetical protein LBH76_02865 [Propionibacteriaceae bacterium]|jgi:DNA-directed RNA polymerase specialized sigma24 family protein|nr:hypothetical protein [Propionibacteriaceae bacterium]
MRATAAPPRPAASLAARLNAEWAAMRDEAPAWPTAWGGTLGEVLAAVAGQPDAVLGELVAACQAGCDQAGRVVLQAFVGKLILMAKADQRLTVDDLAAAFWLRLAAYPLARRPRHIAANLVLDARKDALAEQRALAPALPPPAPPEPYDARHLLQAAHRLRLAPPANLVVAASVYADGLSSADAGARHQLSADAVRWRCADTVRRLRRHRDLLADVCGPRLAAAGWTAT